MPEEIQPGDAESDFAKKRAILGIVLALTAPPGIPMLFQGQEFIEDEYFQDTEQLDWGGKFEKHQGIYKMISDIIKLRTGELEGAFGLRAQGIQIAHFNPENKILAYVRDEVGGGGEQPVMVVLNFSNKKFEKYQIGIGEQHDWKLRINATWEGYDDSFEGLDVASHMNKICKETDNSEWTGELNIPAYGALIYTL